MWIYQLHHPYVLPHAGVEELSGTWLFNGLFWGIKLKFLSKMTPNNLCQPQGSDLHIFHLKDWIIVKTKMYTMVFGFGELKTVIQGPVIWLLRNP